MKKILFLFVALIAICFAAFQFIAQPKAKNNIKNYFTSAGFKHVEINDVAFALNGLTIGNVTLDKDGFNVANNVNASIFWPSYLFKPEIKSIDIETVKISSVFNSSKDILTYKRFLNISTINNIATQNIEIKNIIWDIATPKHALRLKAALTLQPAENGKKVTATLNAAQNELVFDSQWSGTIQNNGDFNLEGLYDRFGINTSILRLYRGAGWVTLSKKSEINNMSAQFDAGSGNLFEIPIKNISLVINQEDNAFPILLRASSEVVDDTNLYGDFTLSPDIEKQAFELLLDIKHPKQFIRYLEGYEILKSKSQAQKVDAEKTGIYLTYEPENRFADGPFPFSLNVKQKHESALEGTFLIYPNNLDVRGTAQGQQSAISLLQALFSIDEKHISDKNIRFDENLKSLF